MASSSEPEYTIGGQLLAKLGRKEYGKLLDNLMKIARKGNTK